MVQINYRDREITAKVVYYGPALSGKTTNLQIIHECINFSQPTKFFSLNTKNDRTLFFDLLPISLGKINDLNIKIQLYTVPGQVQYNSTRKVVLAGCDAIVLVADSQRSEAEANLFSLTNMKSNLRANGLILEQTPWILQYNKRDLPDIMSVEEMNQTLNKNTEVKCFESVAITGEGVFTSFLEIVKMMIESILTKYRMVKTDKELVSVTTAVYSALENIVNNYKIGKEKHEEAAIQPEQPVVMIPESAEPFKQPTSSGAAVQVGDPSAVDQMSETQAIMEDTEPIPPDAVPPEGSVAPYQPTEQNTVVEVEQPPPPLDPAAEAEEQRQITTFQLGQSPSMDGEVAPTEQEFLSNEQLVETAVQANMKITEITNKLAESEAQLSLKVEELQHISELGKALTSELYLDRLLEMILNTAVDHLGVKYAAINLYDAKKNYMEPRQLHNLNEDPMVTILQEKLIKFLKSITSKGKTAVITHNENKSLANALLKYNDYSAFISVSLKSKSNLLGVLNLYYKDSDTFRKEDLRFVILLATYASIAIENALLYTEMNEATNFLNGIVDSSSDGIIKLSPTNRITYINLTAANFTGYTYDEAIGSRVDMILAKDKIKDCEGLIKQAFLGNSMRFQPISLKTKEGKTIKSFCTVAPIRSEENQILDIALIIHTLASEEGMEKIVPAAASGGSSDKLIFALAAELEPQLAEAKEKIELAGKNLKDAISSDKSGSFSLAKAAIEEVSRVVDSTLKLKEAKMVTPPSETKLEDVNVSDILMSIIYMRQAEFDSKGITLDVPSNLPTIRFSEKDLTQVFNSLISQSVNMVRDSSSGKISITHSVDDNFASFYVTSSPVIKNIDINSILADDSSGEDVKGNITMSFVKKLLERFNSKIWIEQPEKDQLEIKFSVPKF